MEITFAVLIRSELTQMCWYKNVLFSPSRNEVIGYFGGRCHHEMCREYIIQNKFNFMSYKDTSNDFYSTIDFPDANNIYFDTKNQLCTTIIEEVLGDPWAVTVGSCSYFAFLITFISYKCTSGDSDCVIDFLDPESICSVTKINLLPQLLKKL